MRAEALRELEEITDFLRKNPWRSRHRAERCVRAVTVTIKRVHTRLAGAVDAEGKPHAVLQAFARHLYEHLLIPSGRGGGHGGARVAAAPAGCFTYEPPAGVVWGGGESSPRHPVTRKQGAPADDPSAALKGTLPMNLPNLKYATDCTIACCEEWLFLTTCPSGSGVQSAKYLVGGILSPSDGERDGVRGLTSVPRFTPIRVDGSGS